MPLVTPGRASGPKCSRQILNPKSSQRHPPSPKEMGETEVKSSLKSITKGVSWPENQRNVFRSLLMFYFIIKHKRSGTE